MDLERLGPFLLIIYPILVKPEEKGDWTLWTIAQPSDANEVHKSIDELKPLVEAEFPWAASKHRA